MLIRQLPRDARTNYQARGDAVMWGPQEHLLAIIADATRARLWQASGGKGRRPKPIPRPGDTDRTERRIGTTVVPLEEFRERLAERRARERGAS